MTQTNLSVINDFVSGPGIQRENTLKKFINKYFSDPGTLWETIGQCFIKTKSCKYCLLLIDK